MAKQSPVSSRSTLTDRLARSIRQHGPISFHDWMEGALYDPLDGYYCKPNRERWGKRGDYRTSPQRSELFAATFARYFAKVYRSLGCPKYWTIAESGAGDGAFAEGVLFTLRDEYAEVFRATRYVIDEVSSASKLLIGERLSCVEDKVEFHSFSSMDPFPTGLIFSNELLDAFPIHLVTCREGMLCELRVDVDPTNEFRFITSSILSEGLAKFCEDNEIRPAEAQLIEVNLEVDRWLSDAANCLQKGYIITVDYGAEAEELHARIKGTLRGYSQHQFVEELLASPGEFDLTTTINWTQVRKVSHRLGLDVVDFRAQDQFLMQEGALVELQSRLDKMTSDAEKSYLTTVARDLILPGGMSSSFQVLVLKR